MTKLSLVWTDGKFTVDLCAADKRVMEKAGAIGEALAAMNQPCGQPLVDAVDAVLGDEPDETPEKPF